MCLTAPPSVPLRLNTRLQQRSRAQSCNTLSSCRLQSAQECFPLLGLIYVQTEILRWRVKERFLEEAGDRTRSSVQGVEGPLVMRYTTQLPGLCPLVGRETHAWHTGCGLNFLHYCLPTLRLHCSYSGYLSIYHRLHSKKTPEGWEKI